MDRKWRLNRQALNTIESIVDFETRYIGTWNESCELATRTDVYAVYTVLHIENKQWELKWSDACRGYYFVTREESQEGTTNTVGGKAGCVTVPEGDEDVSVVVDEEEDHHKDTRMTVLEKVSEVGARQLVVPVSSSLSMLTPRLVHRVCSLGHGTARQVILGLVDSNGVVSRCCLYDYIQAPLEASGVEAELAPGSTQQHAAVRQQP
ncbi:hypothetical protein M9434_003739 [Picochlorum sp. BPE23]|nr:hypothetical protein M9434_003739 [Picochlorum sp. BPE23]